MLMEQGGGPRFMATSLGYEDCCDRELYENLCRARGEKECWTSAQRLRPSADRDSTHFESCVPPPTC